MTISELLREEFRRQKQEEERRKQEEERRNRWEQEDESARLKRNEELSNPLDFDGEIRVSARTDEKTKKLFHREIDNWLYGVWKDNGKPRGAEFLRLLKNYAGKPGSPLKLCKEAGKKAGIEWESSSGATGKMSKKTLQNIISEKFEEQISR